MAECGCEKPTSMPVSSAARRISANDRCEPGSHPFVGVTKLMPKLALVEALAGRLVGGGGRADLALSAARREKDPCPVIKRSRPSIQQLSKPDPRLCAKRYPASFRGRFNKTSLQVVTVLAAWADPKLIRHPLSVKATLPSLKSPAWNEAGEIVDDAPRLSSPGPARNNANSLPDPRENIASQLSLAHGALDSHRHRFAAAWRAHQKNIAA